MNKLATRSKGSTISSLEVAEMIEKEHSKLLKDIRRYSEQLNEAKIGLVDFFQESTYVDAKILNMNQASRLLMIENFYRSYHIPTGFLPKYENNGNREMKAAKHLLSENGCDLSVQKLNVLLIEQGYLEERERPSSKSNGVKKFKALTKKGLQYGENVVSPYNQKEVQPLYYSDTFMELYTKVNKADD